MKGGEFRVSVRQLDGQLAVVELSGEVDMANADHVRQQLVGTAPAECRAVVLDLSKLIYLDSAGIRMIFEISEQLANRGATVAVFVPPDASVRRVLTITRLDTLVPVRDSIEEAAEAASAGATR